MPQRFRLKLFCLFIFGWCYSFNRLCILSYMFYSDSYHNRYLWVLAFCNFVVVHNIKPWHVPTHMNTWSIVQIIKCGKGSTPTQTVFDFSGFIPYVSKSQHAPKNLLNNCLNKLYRLKCVYIHNSQIMKFCK